MRAFTVAVDYADILSLTLPRMRRHFTEHWIITTPGDGAAHELAQKHNCRVFPTDLFTANGARFNKWAALESALDYAGRTGWICLLDADTVWPGDVGVHEEAQREESKQIKDIQEWAAQRPPHPGVYLLSPSVWIGRKGMEGVYVHKGQLFSPLRRMMLDTTRPIPPESEWEMLPVHRNVDEWAGFTQIFHADSPWLGSPPWHDINMSNAGAADSWFQAKCPPHQKVRPSWYCLHIGEPGIDWLGRTNRRVDGSIPEGAQGRREEMRRMWQERYARKREGRDPFELERLKK